jgi:hypothetical protein
MQIELILRDILTEFLAWIMICCLSLDFETMEPAKEMTASQMPVADAR